KQVSRVGEAEGHCVVAGLREVRGPLDHAGGGGEEGPGRQPGRRERGHVAVRVGAGDLELQQRVLAAVLPGARGELRRPVGGGEREGGGARQVPVGGADGDRVSARLAVSRCEAEHAGDRVEDGTGGKAGGGPGDRVAFGIRRGQLQTEGRALGDGGVGNGGD